jgi:hypothetical protein
MPPRGCQSGPPLRRFFYGCVLVESLIPTHNAPGEETRDAPVRWAVVDPSAAVRVAPFLEPRLPFMALLHGPVHRAIAEYAAGDHVCAPEPFRWTSSRGRSAPTNSTNGRLRSSADVLRPALASHTVVWLYRSRWARMKLRRSQSWKCRRRMAAGHVRVAALVHCELKRKHRRPGARLRPRVPVCKPAARA